MTITKRDTVRATAIFADELDVELLKRIIDCAKSGMTRADTAIELGIHYTVLSSVASLLKINFKRNLGNRRTIGQHGAEAVRDLVQERHRIAKPMRPRAGESKRTRKEPPLVRQARVLVSMGYSIDEAARMYRLPPEVLRDTCKDTRAVAS